MDLGSVTESRPSLVGGYWSKASSVKQQASSLTAGPGDDRMDLERNNMDTTQLKRIADALEEILRLVKKDMDANKKTN